jgi:uncharacterized phage protein gp47/JayE
VPFATPTLKELRDRIASDIETRVPGADARTRRSILGVLSFVLAAGFYALYGFLSWIARQVLVDTAEDELLDRHAGIYGIVRDAAVRAQFNVAVTGTNGTLIPVGTVLARADAEEFTTNADGTIAAGTVTITVTARKAGASGNTSVGTSLPFASPISGALTPVVAAAAPATDVVGADEQDDDDLRAEVLARIQNPPQGGAAHDYVAWAKGVPGVTRAWATSPGVGEVQVYFVRDVDHVDGASWTDIIPSAGEVTAVDDYIDARRPVTADVTVSAPTGTLDAFTIHISPDTATIRAAVEDELDDLYLRAAEPGATIFLSQIREAVSRAAGESDNTVSVPAGNITHASDQMPLRGTITWV